MPAEIFGAGMHHQVGAQAIAAAGISAWQRYYRRLLLYLSAIATTFFISVIFSNGFDGVSIHIKPVSGLIWLCNTSMSLISIKSNFKIPANKFFNWLRKPWYISSGAIICVPGFKRLKNRHPAALPDENEAASAPPSSFASTFSNEVRFGIACPAVNIPSRERAICCAFKSGGQYDGLYYCFGDSSIWLPACMAMVSIFIMKLFGKLIKKDFAAYVM